MTIGEKLLVSICTNKDSELFIKVKPPLLLEKSEVELYEFIKEYYSEHGEFSPLSVIQDHFGRRFPRPKGKPKFYYEEARILFSKAVISDRLPKVGLLLDDDVEEAIDLLREIGSIATYEESESRDTHYGKDSPKRKKRYEKRKEFKGIVYISTGHPTLDDLLFGWQETDLITFGGRSGIGKTWWLLWMTILLDHYIKACLEEGESLPYGRKNILLISNEVNEEEVGDRMDCLNCHLNYTRFLGGALTRREEDKFLKHLDVLEESPNDTRITILYNITTIHELELKIKAYNPIATFIDGSYLFEPQMEESYQKTVYITRMLKMITLSSRSPIINTTQLRKGKGTQKSATSYDAQDAFYHGSYVQDSDVAIKGWQDADLLMQGVIALSFAKARRLPQGTQLHWSVSMEDTTYNYFNPEEEDETFDSTTSEW